jgi:phosphate transport system protein
LRCSQFEILEVDLGSRVKLGGDRDHPVGDRREQEVGEQERTEMVGPDLQLKPVDSAPFGDCHDPESGVQLSLCSCCEGLTWAGRGYHRCVRATLAQQLAEIEHRIEDEMERAAVTLADIASAIQVPTVGNAAEIAEAGRRLHQAGRSVDADLVIVTARQSPLAGDLRLVLALIEAAHHAALIARQFGLISEQLVSLSATSADGAATALMLSAMTHLAGSQLLHAVTAFASRDLALARRIDVEDDEIDHINRDIFEATLALEDPPEKRELALRHVLIARSVERIGDNAVDIAEQAAFLVTAERWEFTDASRPKRRRRQRA